MVIKMKSISFKRLFKNIRYKRTAYSNLPGLDSFGWCNIDPKMPNQRLSYMPAFCPAWEKFFLFLKSRNLNSYF